MAERTWIAVALACLVWFGYVKWFAPPAVSPPSAGMTTATAPEAGAPSGDPAGVTQSLASPAPIGETWSTRYDGVELKFSTVGGLPIEASVEGYRESLRKDSPMVRVLKLPETQGTFATVFSDPDLKALDAMQYQRKGDAAVTWMAGAGGLSVTKTYRHGSKRYHLEGEITLRFDGTKKRDWGTLSIPLGARQLTHDTNDPMQSWEAVYYQNDSMQRTAAESIKEGDEVHQGATGWLAFGNRYFSSVFIVPSSGLNPDVVLARGPQFEGLYARYPLQLKEGQSEISIPFRLYLGPKDYQLLADVPGLTKLIDYGIFSWLAFPLLALLKFFYGYVHNYGMAIILLTLMVRGIFYPLSLKSYRSMKSMQKLQPQIQALKEKHKADPKKFNEEQLALFRAHKVNPAGGCLPMLIQLPVFIALYAVLANSIELYHAPFFGWVQDLSSKDPFYVYPVLMGFAMLGQQRLTPTPGMDPIQVKMMYLMPVVFTFVMLKLPSGLTMYIFLSTLLGILQQLVINRDSHPALKLAGSSANSPVK